MNELNSGDPGNPTKGNPEQTKPDDDKSIQVKVPPSYGAVHIQISPSGKGELTVPPAGGGSNPPPPTQPPTGGTSSAGGATPSGGNAPSSLPPKNKKFNEIKQTVLWIVLAVILILDFYVVWGKLPWLGWIVFMSLFLSLVMLQVVLIPILALFEFCFLYPKESRAYPLTRGNVKAGFVMSYDGYHLNDPRDGSQFNDNYRPWQVLPNDSADKDGHVLHWEDKRNFVLKFFGIYYLGIPVKTLYYPLVWREWRTEANGENKVWTRGNQKGELTNFIFVKSFPYASQMKRVEIVGREQVDVDFTFFVSCVNPDTAIFRNENWFTQVESHVQDALRSYLNKRNYDELTAPANTLVVVAGSPAAPVGASDIRFEELVNKLNYDIPTLLNSRTNGVGNPAGTIDHYGLRIDALKIDQIELVDDTPGAKVREAMVAQTINTEQGKAALVKANYDADVAAKLADGEVKRIKAVYGEITSHKDMGILIRQFEAVEKSGEKGNTIVWANNFLQQGGVSELAKIMTENGVGPSELIAIIKQVKK
ncbi:MAG: hypothetical protein WCT19_00980 [Candidatus Paceibacterota bacterium]